MGKARGVSRRRKKKYNYKVNRKKLHKKQLKLPNIECKQLKQAWDNQKSILNNMQEMGLSADPNKTLKIPSAKDLLDPKFFASNKSKKISKLNTPKISVAKDLEKEATAPQPKRFRLPLEIVKYCIYMIEKYGDDYKAMARDPKNHYQDTPKQIRRKIEKLKKVPEQWNAYMRTKCGDDKCGSESMDVSSEDDKS